MQVLWRGYSARFLLVIGLLGAILSTTSNALAQTTQTNLAVTVRHATSLNGNGGIEGSLQQLLGESLTINGGFVMAGDLLVPGTPTLRLNGNPAYAGTVAGTGSATPTGYQVTLNGNCSMNYLRTRTTPVTLPTVSAPPQPAGTRTVTINSAGQSIGDPATLRNLALNGNVGQIAVPPGTYGSFTANGGSGFTLGVAGATAPTTYNLQNLNLNGNSQLGIVGPIILTVANGFSANGLVGATNESSWLQLQIASGGFTLNSGSTVHGSVVAPSGTVMVNGNSLLLGSVQSDRLTVNGGGIIKWSGSSATANQPPTANGQGLSVVEDIELNITLVGTDPEGAALSYTVLSQPAHGMLTGSAPNLVYRPGTNFNGTESFTFKVNDGQADSAAATVSITVTPVNDAPAALAENISTPEDTLLNLTLSGTDVENDSLTFSVVAPPVRGTVSGTAPNLTYHPPANYTGPDSFTFKAYDGQAYSAPATVSITVTAVDDAPVAQGQSVSTDEDTSVPVVLNALDVEGDGLVFTVLTPPTHGTLSGMPPNLLYTPATNYNGTDLFTFIASDWLLDSAPATVSLAIQPVNDAPVANAVATTTLEDTATNVVLTGSDADGDSLSFTIVTPPAHGTLHGSPPQLTYSPAADYNGADSFTFVANDGHTNSVLATASLAATPVNDPPVADAATVGTDENAAVTITLAGSDVENDPLTYSIVTPPTHGTLAFSLPPSTFLYTPATDYSGADSFTFTANDGTSASAPATVAITIQPTSDAPVADNQTLATDEDTLTFITLTGSDAEDDALTFAVVTQPAHGTLSGSEPDLIYTPNLNYNGTDSFTFTANDGERNSESATVTITVNPVNDEPTASSQLVDTLQDSPVSVTLTGGDADGDPLTFQIIGQPAYGLLSGTAPNLVYVPALDFRGNDSFAFVVNDGSADSARAEISITVRPVERPLRVFAGQDHVLVGSSSASLKGRASYVGSAPPGVPNFTWSVVVEPAAGAASLADVHDSVTTATFGAAGAYRLRLTAADGQRSQSDDVHFWVIPPPPEPSAVAPPIDLTEPTSVAKSAAFLYSGSNPLQGGVAAGTIEVERAAVVRGRVTDRSGNSLTNVGVTVLGHPELGATATRGDGWFDIAVNGGGPLTFKFEKPGLITTQRRAEVPWQDYLTLPEVVMLAYDDAETTIALNLGPPRRRPALRCPTPTALARRSWCFPPA